MSGDQRRSCKCLINDRLLHETYSATVTVRKTVPIRKSTRAGRIDLVDVFIAPISGQPDVEVHHHFACTILPVTACISRGTHGMSRSTGLTVLFGTSATHLLSV